MGCSGLMLEKGVQGTTRGIAKMTLSLSLGECRPLQTCRDIAALISQRRPPHHHPRPAFPACSLVCPVLCGGGELTLSHPHPLLRSTGDLILRAQGGSQSLGLPQRLLFAQAAQVGGEGVGGSRWAVSLSNCLPLGLGCTSLAPPPPSLPTQSSWAIPGPEHHKLMENRRRS